jgi:WD40 repeat protein
MVIEVTLGGKCMRQLWIVLSTFQMARKRAAAFFITLGFGLVFSYQIAIAGTLGPSFGTDQEVANPHPDTDEIGQGFFELWRALVAEQGHEDILRNTAGTVSACIPWDRVQRLVDGRLSMYIEHWWHESAASEKNRLLVLDRCETWRTNTDADCMCHIIAEHMRPVLQTPPAQASKIRAIDSTMVQPKLQASWVAEESSTPVIRRLAALRKKSAMQGTPYYFDAGKTISLEADPLRDSSPQLIMQQGHNADIFIGRWSHSGQMVATAGMDYRVLLWRVNGLELLRDWRGHAGIVKALAFSPDDQKVASGGQDGVVIIWNVTSGRRAAILIEKRGEVKNISFRKDGKLFTLYGDNSVVEWTPPVGLENGLEKWTERVVLAPGAATVAFRWQGQYADRGDAIRFKDGANGRREVEIVPSDGPLMQVFDPETGEVDRLAKTWRGLTGAMSPRQGMLAARRSGILFGSAMIYPRGDEIRVSADNGASVLRVLKEAQKGTIMEMAFSPSGGLLATAKSTGNVTVNGTKDHGKIKIWNLDADSPPVSLDGKSVWAFSPDSKLLLGSAGSGRVRIWDAKTGAIKYESAPGRPELATSVFTRDGRWLAVARGDGVIHVWDLDGGRQQWKLRGHPGTIGVLAVDASGRFLAAGGRLSRYVSVWDIKTGKFLWALVPRSTYAFGGESINSINFQEDGTALTYSVWDKEKPRYFVRRAQSGNLLSAYSDGSMMGPNGAEVMASIQIPTSSNSSKNRSVRLFAKSHDGQPGELQAPTQSIGWIETYVFSPDGRYFAVLHSTSNTTQEIKQGPWVSQWDLQSGLLRADLQVSGSHAMTVTADGNIVAGYDDGRVIVFRKREANEGWESINLIRSSGSIRSLSSSINNGFAATGDDGLAHVWSGSFNSPAMTIGSLNDDAWLVVMDDGRFDASTPDRLSAFRWLMPDDPHRMLSPDIFLRDYYEPGLLARGWACGNESHERQTDRCAEEFRRIEPVQQLNRVTPKVTLGPIEPTLDRETVLVHWGAAAVNDPSQQNGKTSTAAYDLRLFRNGQLVARCPSGTHDQGKDSQDRTAWRKTALLRSPCPPAKVRVPAGSASVTFSAYAFNEDRVKSETVEKSYMSLQARGRKVAPRAYVVAMGVDKYAGNGQHDLNFAAKDARDMLSALQRIAGYQVIPVVLTSEKGKPSHATKATLRAVLEILAGNESNRTQLVGVPGGEALRVATPDDLVILTLSGHGHTTEDGSFYLVPSDADPGAALTSSVISSLISSQELSLWLETVDAGQIAIVIDACHSGASIPKSFKPGPLGDGGLGQLAYDKGISLLAATQGSDAALEVGTLRHGVLTYALLEGLQRRAGRLQADSNNDGVTLSEWLAYGNARTPNVYRDVVEGKLPVVMRDPTMGPEFLKTIAARAQTPVYFDFRTRRLDPLIKAR